MRLAGFRVRLMGRFYLIVGLAIVTLVTGMATGFDLFYRLLYILGLTIVFSYVWNWLMVRSLEVNVNRHTRQARVGDNIEETFSVRNTVSLPKHALEVEDQTDLPGYSSGTAVSVSGNFYGYSHSTVSWSTKAPARKRGLYRMGPAKVSNTDPFGIFRRSRDFGGTDDITVFPNTFKLSGFHVPPAELSGDASMRRRTHNVTPHASTVRDYAPGDSLSRVHWNSTARLRKLMSKEFDLGRAGELWVVLDLQKDIQSGELEESTDEYAVSIGASLAKLYSESQMPVGLVAYGDKRYFLEADTGTGHLDRIMQLLAMSKAEGDVPLASVMAREEPLWGGQSTLAVITSSPNEEWVLALREISKRSVRVAVVLLDGASFGGFLNSRDALAPLGQAGILTYLVTKGDDIPAALSRRHTGDGLGTAEDLRAMEVEAVV